MTVLYDPPQPITGRRRPDGTPTYIRGEEIEGAVEVKGRWIAELDWWAEPVDREYWRLLVGGKVLVEVFRDRTTGQWFLERLYD